MPEWTARPPETTHDIQYRLVRTPANKPVHLIILAEQLTGCHTHYFKGRTTPCEGPTCEACHIGVARRWHAYAPAVIPPANEKIIIELTAQAATQLDRTIDEYRTLRGIEIMAERPSRRPNGRIRLTTAPGRRPEAGLPECPDVHACLAHIWGIDDKPLPPHRPDPSNRGLFTTAAETALRIHGNGDERP